MRTSNLPILITFLNMMHMGLQLAIENDIPVSDKM